MTKYVEVDRRKGKNQSSGLIQEEDEPTHAPLLQRADSVVSSTFNTIKSSAKMGGKHTVVSAEESQSCCGSMALCMETTFGNDASPTEFKCRLLYSCFVVSSLMLLMGGVVALAAKETVVKQLVKDYVIVDSEDSPLFEAWVDPSSQEIEQWRCYTFFNITNANATWMGEEVANFEMVGPYCYKEMLSKDRDSVRFSKDRKHVEYSYRNYFQFDAAQSNARRQNNTGTLPIGDDNDKVVMLNIGIYGLQYRFQDIGTDMGGIPKSLFCDILDIVINPYEAISNTSLFVKRSIKEILWGYTDPIWEAVQPELSALSYVASSKFLTEWNGSYPVPSPYSYRSGQMCPLWGDYNNTCNSTVNMVTREATGGGGYDSYKELGQISQWASQKQTWWWGPEVETYTKGLEVLPRPIVAPPAEGEEYPNEQIAGCNDITGTNAMRWGPIDVVHRDAKLTTFLDLFWRTIYFTYEQETSVKDIPTLRFVLAAESIDNSSKNQACFQSYHRGIFNFSRPMFGPVYAVKNMMLDAEYTDKMVNFTMQVVDNSTVSRVPFREFIDKVLGAKKDPVAFRKQYDSYLDVHALTGVSLQALAQGMAFTDIHPIAIDKCNTTKFKVSKNLPNTMYPLVAVHRSYVVPDNLANQIKAKLRLIRVAEVLMGAATLLGAALTTIACALFILRRRRCFAAFEGKTGHIPNK